MYRDRFGRWAYGSTDLDAEVITAIRLDDVHALNSLTHKMYGSYANKYLLLGLESRAWRCAKFIKDLPYIRLTNETMDYAIQYAPIDIIEVLLRKYDHNEWHFHILLQLAFYRKNLDIVKMILKFGKPGEINLEDARRALTQRDITANMWKICNLILGRENGQNFYYDENQNERSDPTEEIKQLKLKNERLKAKLNEMLEKLQKEQEEKERYAEAARKHRERAREAERKLEEYIRTMNMGGNQQHQPNDYPYTAHDEPSPQAPPQQMLYECVTPFDRTIDDNALAMARSCKRTANGTWPTKQLCIEQCYLDNADRR